MREFIEINTLTRPKHNSKLSGETIITSRRDDRVVMVFASSGLNGIESNVVASTIASMAMNNSLEGKNPLSIVQSIVNIFGNGISALTIVDVHNNGTVNITEYRTPAFVLFRDKIEVIIPSQEFEIENGTTHKIRISNFTAEFQDRIIIFSEGVIKSGEGEVSWSREGVITTLADTLLEKPQISAQRITRVVVSRADMNDMFDAQNDMSCGSIYFREPRKMLICTGPPFDEKNDKTLARRVEQWQGTKIISGGTTAKLISRELGREININLKRDVSGLPPTGEMEGIDLISEGVLTLAKVKEILEKAGDTEIIGKGTDYSIARMLLSHDVIYFLVGTRINTVHQDPDLPIELEIRTDVVKYIAEILEKKFLKEVKIDYI